MLLKKLTEAAGVSGSEKEVREMIKREIQVYADQVSVDKLGNLIAYKRANQGNTGSLPGRSIQTGMSTRRDGDLAQESGVLPVKKVMLAAHMDEVGLMVTRITEDGLLKFRPIGGIDERVLVSKSVLVGDKKIPGVIGSKPIHLQERKERNHGFTLKNMYIDIGSSGKEEVQRLVSPGDYAVFRSDYVEFGDGCIKAKALDDRVGCAILMDILRERYEFDLYACFTAQEENGVRGSSVAAYAVNPDIALVLEGTVCPDLPGSEEDGVLTRMGMGAVITILDRSVYVDRRILRFLEEVARKRNIPYQYKQINIGSTDGGRIHLTRDGIPTGVVAVPCRYIHSPSSMASRKDIDACQQLVRGFLEELGRDVTLIGKIGGEEREGEREG